MAFIAVEKIRSDDALKVEVAKIIRAIIANLRYKFVFAYSVKIQHRRVRPTDI